MHEITDEMTGTYRVTTATGSRYLLCLDEPRYLVRLPRDVPPSAEYQKAEITGSDLRLDAQKIPLVSIVRLRVGDRGILAVDVVQDGATITVRDTSQVVEIVELAGAGPGTPGESQK